MLNQIIERFKFIKDFRQSQGKRHQLWVVLTIIILAIITGNVTYKAIEEFTKNERSKLIKILGISHQRLPSYSTIRRVLMGVNPEDIQVKYQEIIKNYTENLSGSDWIAIDGKSLKNTLTNYDNKDQNMLIIVSWFSQKTKIVIKSESLESKKGSESAKVQTMIEECGLIGKVLTLDALHCSKDTTQVIIDSKNDYLITVKGNQVKLHNRLKELGKKEKPLTIYKEKEVRKGRNINRKVSVFDSQNINQENYTHAQSFIKVERQGFRGREEYKEEIYYISSQKLEAKTFAEKIREHWLIENQVHWVKDVIFKEDKSNFKEMKVGENYSLLVTLTLNIYRSLGFFSISEGKSWLGKNWEKILAIA